MSELSAVPIVIFDSSRMRCSSTIRPPRTTAIRGILGPAATAKVRIAAVIEPRRSVCGPSEGSRGEVFMGYRARQVASSEVPRVTRLETLMPLDPAFVDDCPYG